jgi:hypothetical protein
MKLKQKYGTCSSTQKSVADSSTVLVTDIPNESKGLVPSNSAKSVAHENVDWSMAKELKDYYLCHGVDTVFGQRGWSSGRRDSV